MLQYNNIAQVFESTAGESEGRPALWYEQGGSYEYLTYQTVAEYSNLIADTLLKDGVSAGDKVLLMLKLSPEFVATVFALFRIGAIPVLIDPGMGVSRLMECVRDLKPTVLVALPKVHWFRWLKPFALGSITRAFSFGRFTPLSVRRLPDADALLAHVKAKKPFPAPVPMHDSKPEDTAAILFTTGSTGPAKGVVYTHKVLLSQTGVIAKTYDAGPDYFDMPVFPSFALFSLALGMPFVIPPIDPTCPAKADPVKVIKVVKKFNVSFSFGSPAFWQTVAQYCIHHNIKLFTLRKVLMAGAPPSPELLRMMRQILADDAKVCIPYGATEAMPIATFSGSEVVTETAKMTAEGAGSCLGYPIGDADIRIIKAIDAPIVAWDDSLELPHGEIGEIVVKGSVVTPEYYEREEDTVMAKIRDGDTIWHRMGDMGYIDAEDRLWFCGRKAHRVISARGPLYSVCCEAIFNSHPDVRRSALVGIGKNGSVPAIIIEPQKGAYPKAPRDRENFTEEVLAIGAKSPLTESIMHVLFYRDFPVDVRHNAKISREKLAEWAVAEIPEP